MELYLIIWIIGAIMAIAANSLIILVGIFQQKEMIIERSILLIIAGVLSIIVAIIPPYYYLQYELKRITLISLIAFILNITGHGILFTIVGAKNLEEFEVFLTISGIIYIVGAIIPFIGYNIISNIANLNLIHWVRLYITLYVVYIIASIVYLNSRIFLLLASLSFKDKFLIIAAGILLGLTILGLIVNIMYLVLFINQYG